MDKIKIGIVAAPEFPTNLAYNLVEDLESQLSYQFGEDFEWDIEVVTDALTAVAEESDELVNELEKYTERKNWSYIFCLTDLPGFSENIARLAHLNLSKKIAVLSIPAFGWATKKRIQKMVIQLIQRIYDEDEDTREEREEEQDKTKDKGQKSPLFSTIRTEKKKRNNNLEIDYLFRSKWLGRLVILLGMAYANRPWQVMTSFRSVIGIAFSSGAYGLIFPTLWMLSYEYSLIRLIGFTMLSISSMIIWIIQSHNLWEKPSTRSDKSKRILYNITTVLTLAIAVMLYYVILLLLFLILVFFIVPPDLFVEEVDMSGSPGLLDFIKIGWTAASVGTLAGAIGAGIEDEEYVRDSTYGYRQNKRNEEIEKTRKEEKEEKERSY